MISRERIRIKKKIGRRMFKIWHCETPEEADGKDGFRRPIEAYINGYGKTKVPCSCYMCGNPRHYFGEVTIQERKAPTIDEWDD